MEETVVLEFYQAGRGYKEKAWVWASNKILAKVQEIDFVLLTGKASSAVMHLLSMCSETHLVSNIHSTSVHWEDFFSSESQ